jgi:S-adenosylmethionine synthetase
MFAHRILRKMADVRKNTTDATWLRPDCKSQVALKYDNGEMVGIENVVVSTQHSESADNETIRSFITEEIIKPSLPAELLSSETEYLINPTGRFVVGGPEGDSGLTGRKIIVDTYGGWGRHGGGAFSGKIQVKLIALQPTCADGLLRMW